MFEVESEMQLAQANLDCEKYKGDLPVICEQYSKPEAENERLRSELGELTHHYENCKMNLESEKATTEELRNENVKLKCLTLHLFNRLAYHEYKDWGRWMGGLADSKLNKRCARNAARWRRINERCYEAYRKAKKELKDES